jgi:hypothetical protein
MDKNYRRMKEISCQTVKQVWSFAFTNQLKNKKTQTDKTDVNSAKFLSF